MEIATDQAITIHWHQVMLSDESQSRQLPLSELTQQRNAKVNSMNTPIRLVAIATIMATISACSSNPKIDATPTNTAPFELTASSRGPVLTIDDMLFDFEQSTLRSKAQSTVKQTANYLRDNPERIAVIEGHTDHTGDIPYNQMLSLARSTSVRNALLANGVGEHRIRIAGFGETRPVANNNTAVGRQANRRVEIIFQRSAELLSSL